jgi:hypothetical protein
VSSDTGALSRAELTFHVGDRATWLHEPYGGHGYIVPVDGEILDVHPTRIRVAKRSGKLVEHWVKPEHLVPEGWPPHLRFLEEIGDDD